MIIEYLKALLYGIVEGITEWLPISSTGHLILLEDWLPFAFTPDRVFLEKFWEMFEVVIQLGAVLAVVVLFWNTLWPFSRKKTKEEKKGTWSLLFKIVVASIPAGIAGLFGDKLLEILTEKDIDGWLYNSFVVSIALIVYGVAFIVIEKCNQGKMPKVDSLEQIDYKLAFFIGLFEVLALVPGTSRSGSTIIGAMLLGLSRISGAEFSFFMAIPVMVGAGGVKALKFGSWVAEQNLSVPIDAWIVLAIGCAVSFAVSLLAIRFLMNFVKKHSFSSFGIYRIALGVLVLVLWLVGR